MTEYRKPPPCCDKMKEESGRDLTSPPDDGVFLVEDGSLVFAADGVWAVSDAKFCPWCGKVVSA